MLHSVHSNLFLNANLLLKLVARTSAVHFCIMLFVVVGANHELYPTNFVQSNFMSLLHDVCRCKLLLVLNCYRRFGHVILINNRFTSVCLLLLPLLVLPVFV